jgi:hypothetical protein
VRSTFPPLARTESRNCRHKCHAANEFFRRCAVLSGPAYRTRAFLFRTAEVFRASPLETRLFGLASFYFLFSCPFLLSCRPHCCVDLLRRSLSLHPFFITAFDCLVSHEITDEVSLPFAAVPFVPAAPGSFHDAMSSFPMCQLYMRRTNGSNAHPTGAQRQERPQRPRQPRGPVSLTATCSFPFFISV